MNFFNNPDPLAKKILIYTTMVLTSAIIFFTAILGPNHVPSSGVLHEIIRVASILIPSINQLSLVSSFPHLTKVVFSLTWLLIPIQILSFTWYGMTTKLSSELFSRLVIRRRTILLFLLGLMPIYLYAAVFWLGVDGGSSRVGVSNSIELLISTSRTALGITAVTLCLGLSLIISFTIFYLFRVAFDTRAQQNG